ncbi:MAG: class I SAM-dependent methyltransferase [Phycisphaerae bacterium]|nr:class I SAM-dependent methyltransferase [Phycisphaerae bacterium]
MSAPEALPLPVEFASAPLIPTEPVGACPVCRAVDFAPFAFGYDYESRTCRNLWRFVRCAACGHVWLDPRPALSTLATIYPPTYYAYNYASQVNPIARRAKEWLDSRKMRRIVASLPRAPGSFLDVGCGDGRFLRVMESRGIPRSRLFGLELDDRVVRPLADAGFQAFCERVEDCSKIPDGAIDLATMFHVIEHVDDPARVCRAVARWLAPGGVFAVETPNLDSLDARLFHRTHWGGYHIPRHWSLFTPASLQRLLADAGLTPFAVRFQTGHSFWMFSFHHWLRYEGRPMPRLARAFNPLRGLPMLAAFTALDIVRATLGARTSAMLVLARKPA